MRLCPYDKKPCITTECMAWSRKQDLYALQMDDAEGFESLLQCLMMQEGISRKTALELITIRNDNERCKLIDPGQPI